MDNSENNKIIKAIGNLEGTVATGFNNVHNSIKGIHSRQDVANGRTYDLEKRCGGYEKENSKQETDLKWLKKNYWMIVTVTIGGLIAGLLNLMK